MLRLEAAQGKTHDDVETMTRAWAASDSDTTLSLGPEISRELHYQPVSIRSRTAGPHVWPLAPPFESSTMECFREAQV